MSEERKRRRITTVAIWIVALLVLYVLSEGPSHRIAFELWMRDAISMDTWNQFGTVYRPLTWGTARNETARKLDIAYMDLWLSREEIWDEMIRRGM